MVKFKFNNENQTPLLHQKLVKTHNIIKKN